MTRVQKAGDLFAREFYCSQAVLAAFAADFGLDERQALRLGACFGGGMCRGEVCGACTGALMALGLEFGRCEDGDTDSKARADGAAEAFLGEFRRRHGSYLCRDLLGFDLSTAEGRASARERGLFASLCPGLVASAVEIAENLLPGRARAEPSRP